MRRLELDGSDFLELLQRVEALKGVLPVRAHGTSMGRSLPTDSALVLEPIDGQAVRPGDVVLCRAGPRLLLHRAREITPVGVMIQGDALPVPDGRFSFGDIVARVRGSVPRHGVRATLRSLWRSLWSA